MADLPRNLLRTSLILGSEALQKLSESKVTLCGVGGVGGAAAEALARSGVGFIKLIDGDVVDITNLNRQIVSTIDNIGKDKVVEMAKRLKAISPKVELEPVKVMLKSENLAELIKDTDYVVDCIDDISAKTALIVYCLQKNIPIVSAMGAGGRLDPTLLRIGDISETKSDPLAKVMRKRLRDHGIEKGLKVVYSLETPIKAREVEGKLVIGSTAFVPPASGLALASLVVQDLTASIKYNHK